MHDGVYSVGDGVTMRIQGADKAMRALARAGAETSDMKELMHSLGELVVRTAKPRIIPAYAGSTYGTLGECH